MDKPAVLNVIRRASLRQLQVFEAIARHLSFTKAAEELYLAQPTVSVQIKKLGDTVGVPLFEQIGKRVYLTDGGKALYSACREVFDTLARFEMEVADLKGLKEGLLKISIVTTAKYFIPGVLANFCKRYPGVDISLNVVPQKRLLKRMSSNMDELYIMGHSEGCPDPHFEPFLHNPLVVLAPSNHPLASEQGIPLATIAKEPFIMSKKGSSIRLAVENLFREHGLQPNIRTELSSNEAIKQAVAGGMGVSVLSSHTFALEDAVGKLRVLDVEDFPIHWYWYIGRNAGKQLSVVAQAFLDFLKSDGIYNTEEQIADRLRCGTELPIPANHGIGSLMDFN